jgi:hypothetical protein
LTRVDKGIGMYFKLVFQTSKIHIPCLKDDRMDLVATWDVDLLEIFLQEEK